ncbi:MAG: gliding motility-associated ABC transporter substrate-binding protein GldG [Flavobacteriales bacterium]|nr:gliding motility-associated ABC transporter substrate-binding protein GldG [Flavobacteriales bacterium]
MVKEASIFTGRKNKRWTDLMGLIIGLASIFLVNYLGSFLFERFDLTAEKRYTLSDATISTLEELEDVIFIRVYLDGDLPTEFREMRASTKEMLDDMRAYAGANLEYEFINPSASPQEEERVDVYKELTRQGLQFTNIRMRAGDKVSEQIIFPGAILSFNGKETPIQLLKSQAGSEQSEMIELSIQQLEYAFMSGIQKLGTTTDLHVAFIEGHGELDKLETADAERALSEFYAVERITIDEQLGALDGLDAIIIAQPDSAFSEKDKFIIDQFIMRGGKVMWCIDPVFARMDSLKQSQFTMGLVLEHNLTDQLFKYGARLNNDLVLDLEALPIPIVTGMVGNQPNYEMFTWYYMPLISGHEGHPISNNMERLRSEFVSTLDLVDVDGVTGHPLLQTSEKSRLVNAPTRISFNMLRETPRYEMYSGGPYTVGALLEGSFPSVFKNRLPKQIVDNQGIQFLEKSEPTKMIVVSDGDIFKNELSRSEEKFYALGYYKYTDQMYGNREFLLNAMNYLLDDSGLINVRNKEYKIRLLDQAKVDEKRYYWQGLNTAFPIMLVLMLGGLRMWLRRRTYGN